MEDKAMGMVKVGEKGQIVIPKEIRDMFEIKAGDNLLVLADIKQGIIITKANNYIDFANSIVSLFEKSGDNKNDN